jgi:hypothetical protein
VENHNLESRARHQKSLKGFSQSSAAVQQWVLEKRTPKEQGQDQMDRVMFLLATGREAVQKAGAEAHLEDIKDALESQKTRRRIDSRWAKKLEASRKDLQWIAKYRQRDQARQQEQDTSQRALLAPAGNIVSGADLARSRNSGRALPRSGSSIQSTNGAAEADVRSQQLGAGGKVDPGQEASDRPNGTPSRTQETVDGAEPNTKDTQDEARVQAPTVPSYMAANESWRRRNDGFCRGRAIRAQLASS